jgi:hypothetical protein
MAVRSKPRLAGISILEIGGTKAGTLRDSRRDPLPINLLFRLDPKYHLLPEKEVC